MRDIGIPRARQRALIGTLDELLRMPGLDHDVARCAIHLKGTAGGYEPAPDALAFVGDAPPLVPAPGQHLTTAT